jgi:hypothetical protein
MIALDFFPSCQVSVGWLHPCSEDSTPVPQSFPHSFPLWAPETVLTLPIFPFSVHCYLLQSTYYPLLISLYLTQSFHLILFLHIRSLSTRNTTDTYSIQCTITLLVFVLYCEI